MLANAGLEGAVIINKVRESKAGIGFDASTEEYVDMVEAGILDPAKVTRSALQNATSVASTLLDNRIRSCEYQRRCSGNAGRRKPGNGYDVI